MRLKMIKRAILEQLGVQDMCTCRLFLHSSEKGDEQTKTEESNKLSPGEELTGEMSTLSQLNL